MIRVSTAIRGYSGVQQRGWSFKGAGDSGVQRRTAAGVVFPGCGRFGGTAAYWGGGGVSRVRAIRGYSGGYGVSRRTGA